MRGSSMLSAEAFDKMPSEQGQSSEHGFISQEEANSNGHSNEMDDDADFLCICGTNDPGEWIECGNRSCQIRWFHLTCTSLEKAPAGLWLCAECKPTLAADHHTRSPKQKPSITPQFPGLGRGAPAQPRKEARVKKGVATKKAMPKKEKPRWKGWVELSEIEDKKRKRLVEEPWAVRILPQQRRSRTNKSKEVNELYVEEEKDGSDEEPLSTRDVLPRRRSNIKTKAVSVKSQGRAQKVRIVEDETETDEEPLSARMIARQGRLRAKVRARTFVNGKDAGPSRVIGGIRSDIQDPLFSWDRSSSVEHVAQDAAMQNQDEVENETHEEFRCHTDQNAYDGLKEEVNTRSPESSDENIVRERSVTGDDTESEFEGFPDDEETMDDISISSHQKTLDGDDSSRHEANSDSDISIKTAAERLLNAAAVPMQQRWSPNTSSGASSSGNSEDASHLQRHKSSSASQAAGESEICMTTTGEYKTLGERSTLPRLE